jgi:serine/threonine-protein kinase
MRRVYWLAVMATYPDAARAVEVGALIAETYEVTGLIGRGGMGTVWAANHRRLPGKQVAIKVLHSEVARDADALARFRREAEVASRLGHPNIVEVIDFNTLPDGAPYLVLERLRGEGLDARLARGPLALNEALAIARQIGSALGAAHREQVVHRDLKPQNIFLCPLDIGGDLTTQVKVLDFGISKIRGSQTIKTQESTMLGTPQYMAPEQARGNQDEVDARTDIFSLGVILYEMLCGAPAFGGQSVPEVVFKVVYEAPQPLAQLAPDVPPTVVAAVERAMAKERAARFADVASFIEALTGRPLVTHRPAPAAAPAGRADVATAETQQSDAYAKTAWSGRRDLPLPSANTVVGSKPRPGDALAHAATAMAATDQVGKARPAPGAADRRSARVYVVAGLATVLAGGLFYYLLRAPSAPHTLRGPPPIIADSRHAEPAASTVPAPPRAAAPSVPSGSRATEAEAAAAKAEATKAARKRAAAEAARERAAAEEPAEEDVPTNVAQDLRAAEAAAQAGDWPEAMRLAKRSLRTRKTGRAYAILTMAYCHEHDLGNARPNFRKVPARLRADVLRECDRCDIDVR